LKNLSIAIVGKLPGSALASHIANRMFKGRAPKGAQYPYIVYLLVTNNPEKTFTENFENPLLQFSCFSCLSSSDEVENIYDDLIALYDECSLSVAGYQWFYWMKRINENLNIEDHMVKNDTTQVWHYVIEYEIKMLAE